MYPTILFTNELKTAEKYIHDVIKKNDFNPSYIYKIEPKEKAILIEQIRDLNSLVQIKTPSKRLISIHSFETATIEAQNAMLKLLEEKTSDNLFILVVNDIQKILPTILSRSNIIDFFVENNAIETELEDSINKAIENPTVEMLGDSKNQVSTKEEAIELLKKIIIVLEKKIKKGDARSVSLTRKAFDLLYKLESNNLNPQLAVDSFFTELL